MQALHKPQLDWLDQQQAAMEGQLKQWCLINTGTENITGLEELRLLIAEAFSQLDCSIEHLDSAPIKELADAGEVRNVPVGKCLHIRKQSDATAKKAIIQRVMLVGHMDTVFAYDHHFQDLTPLENNKLQGPGTADMKGGILVMLYALKAFMQSPLADQLEWQVFLNADEETGSRGSDKYLREFAQKADYGLVYEPTMPDASLAGARKGSGNFSILVKGLAAHAGRAFHEGKNAIAGLCELFDQLHQLNTTRDSITLNLGRIQGGGALNVVPDTATGHFNIRTETVEDQIWFAKLIQEKLDSMNNQANACKFELHGGFTRPPKPMNEATQKLCNLVKDCGHKLGLTIGFKATGGCCDGNNLSSAGLPCVDTLGVRGANIHSDKEFICLDSLTERAKLSYLILTEIAKGAL